MYKISINQCNNYKNYIAKNNNESNKKIYMYFIYKML